MGDEKPDFAFGTNLGVSEVVYDNVPALINLFGRLLVCMQETNRKHGVGCAFFRLDFRQTYFDETLEFPLGSMILDMKWGCKKEIQDKKKERCGS